MIGYKLYRGIVVNNTDPENLGRKQIRILPYMKDVSDSNCKWCSPWLWASGSEDTLKYKPLPIGTKIYVLAPDDDSFVTGYWIGEKHIESFFNFNSIKTNLEAVAENSTFSLEDLQFEQDPSGNIYFRKIDTGNCGILHHSGSYIVFDDNGKIVLNSGSQNTTIDAAQILLNGNSKSFVTYAELNTALQAFLLALNALFSTKVDGGGSAGTLSLDISASATTTVKTDG